MSCLLHFHHFLLNCPFFLWRIFCRPFLCLLHLIIIDAVHRPSSSLVKISLASFSNLFTYSFFFSDYFLLFKLILFFQHVCFKFQVIFIFSCSREWFTHTSCFPHLVHLWFWHTLKLSDIPDSQTSSCFYHFQHQELITDTLSDAIPVFLEVACYLFREIE